MLHEPENFVQHGQRLVEEPSRRPAHPPPDDVVPLERSWRQRSAPPASGGSEMALQSTEFKELQTQVSAVEGKVDAVEGKVDIMHQLCVELKEEIARILERSEPSVRLF